MRMWVAVDIQMKGGQFGLVKAIMPTSACAVMSRCVRASEALCGKGNDYGCVGAFVDAHARAVRCGFNTLWL